MRYERHARWIPRPEQAVVFDRLLGLNADSEKSVKDIVWKSQLAHPWRGVAFVQELLDARKDEVVTKLAPTAFPRQWSVVGHLVDADYEECNFLIRVIEVMQKATHPSALQLEYNRLGGHRGIVVPCRSRLSKKQAEWRRHLFTLLGWRQNSKNMWRPPWEEE